MAYASRGTSWSQKRNIPNPNIFFGLEFLHSGRLFTHGMWTESKGSWESFSRAGKVNVCTLLRSDENIEVHHVKLFSSYVERK